MTPIKRPVVAACAVVLLGVALAACGDDGAPTNASQEDFCREWTASLTAASALGAAPSESGWSKVQAEFGRFRDVGTPDGLGDVEREGFGVIVKAMTETDYATAKDSFASGSTSFPGVSAEDQEKARTFSDWANKTCGTL